MKFRVIVPARNEAAHIERTIRGFDTDTTETIVALNGSEDNTGSIARRAGALVIESPMPGKIPGAQAVLKELDIQPDEPFGMVDADTHPLLASRYVAAMQRARKKCDPNLPAAIVGPSIYARDNNPLVAARWTLRHYMAQRQNQRPQEAGRFCGRNMLLHAVTSEALEEFLNLPPFWPRADIAMVDSLVQHGGEIYKPTNISTFCVTSARRYNGLFARVTLGAEASRLAFQQSYVNDSPPGAIPYVSWQESMVNQISLDAGETI